MRMTASHFLKLIIILNGFAGMVVSAAPSPVTAPAMNTVPILSKPVSAPLPESSSVSVAQVTSDAQSAPSPAPRLWNLQDADVLSVINEVAQETGKNFVVDPRVSGKISLISSKPLKQREVYQVFLSVLGVLGYSAIPSGDVIKIVPNMESGEQATKVATNASPGKGDETVVRVIPLENISAAQIIPVLRPLMPQWGNIASYSPGNVLILFGRAANLERIDAIIQEVDDAANNSVQIIPLKYASASQVAMVLNNLQASSRAAGESTPLSIAIDERSNSVLIGGPKAQRVRMRILISQLDAPAGNSSGNTEVVYLRYLEAKTFAPLLGKIAQNMLGKDVAGARLDTAMAASNGGYNNMSNSSGGNASKEAEPVNQTVIQAEPSTNAIIITAPPTLMKSLKAIVTKLDVRPAQVLVESIIAEVDESNLTSLGIQWGSSGTAPENAGANITSFPQLGAGIVGVIPGADIQAVLSVLQNQSGVDILSTPSIMVLDNQKATIEVGQEVPFQTGSYSTPPSGGTVTPYNTIDQKAVTLKLDVTPQINLGTSVRLKLSLKNDTLQNPQNPGLNPIINTSKIMNAVLVKSDDVLVLGGLIHHSNNENINRVPILSNLPIVGSLFQQKTSQQSKRNLVVFIKPVIIHGEEDGMDITSEKYNMVRMTQANFREDLSTIGNDHVDTRLPPWKNTRDLPAPFAADKQ